MQKCQLYPRTGASPQTPIRIHRHRHPESFWTGLLDLITVRFITAFADRPLHFFGTFGLIPFVLGGLLETYGVGHCTIPLLGLPFVKDPSDLREPASAVRSFPVRRHALFMGERADTDNGVLRAAIWLRSTKRESSRLRSAFRAWPYFAAAASAGSLPF